LLRKKTTTYVHKILKTKRSIVKLFGDYSLNVRFFNGSVKETFEFILECLYEMKKEWD